MDSTYTNLKQLSNLYRGTTNLSEATLTYKTNHDPITYAYVVCKLYPYLKTVSNRFWGLTEEDKTSFILQEVNRAMERYDQSKGASVQTVISRYVHNRLRMETEQLQYDRRSANYKSDSYEEFIETNTEEVALDNGYADRELHNIIEDADTLTDKERLYCKIVLSEPHKLMDTEIARMMGITSMGVNYIKGRLANKLAHAI